MNNLTVQEFESRNCRYWVGAAIAAATAIGSAIIGAVSQNKQARKAKRTAMELAKYNSQLNEDMYLKYQTPEAQMAQYRKAGLNPNLIYGQSVSGPSAGQADYSSEMAPNTGGTIAEGVLKAINAYQNVSMNEARISQAEAVARAQDAKAALDESRVTAQNIQNAFNQTANSYRLEGLSHDLAIKAIERDLKERYAAIEEQQKLENLIAEGNLTKQQEKNAKKQVEVYEQQIQESIARVRNMQQQIALGFGQLSLDKEMFKENQKVNDHRMKMDDKRFKFDNKKFNIESARWQQRQMMDWAKIGLDARKGDFELMMDKSRAGLRNIPFVGTLAP